MPALTPNDLPAEIVVKILLISLGQVDELDATQRRSKLSLLKSCSLVSRCWVQVSQSLLFQNVMIYRSRTLALFGDQIFSNLRAKFKFVRSLEHKLLLAKYVRKLSLGFPGWDHPNSIEISESIEKIFNQLESLEELELKPPFDHLISHRIANQINSLKNIKKLNLKWKPRTQAPTNSNLIIYPQIKPAYPDSDARDLSSKSSTSQLDGFCNIILPNSVQDLQLIEPSIQFIHDIRSVFSNFLDHSNRTTTTPEKRNHLTCEQTCVEQSNQKLKSLTIRFSDSQEPDPNPHIYLVDVLSPILTSFSWCQNSEIDRYILDLLTMTPNLEHLKLSRVGLTQTMFRSIKPLKLLKSLNLTVCVPTRLLIDVNDINLNWIEFSDLITRFLAQSPFLETFEFDADLVKPSVLMPLLLELLYTATQVPTLNHSRLKHLSVKHNDPMSASSIERLCNKAPLLESLNVKIQTRDLALIKVQLLKLKELKSIELNNFKMVKNQDSKFLDISPFLTFCEQHI